MDLTINIDEHNQVHLPWWHGIGKFYGLLKSYAGMVLTHLYLIKPWFTCVFVLNEQLPFACD